MKEHPSLKIFNTETRSYEQLVLSKGQNTLRMYTCGPTIYNYAHIGNFRTYVFEDLLRRTIKYFGIPIIQVMNITDIDDKTIKGALEKGCSLAAYTKEYKEAFFDDLMSLKIERVEFYPAATDHIAEMIKMIQTLLDNKMAYKSKEGDVFFSIKTFPSYGRLSHLCLSELKSGASMRVQADEYDKESASDFVLWKAYHKERDGAIFWESPFGRGRPGWHIECSAMATKLLGESIDIHVGGVDNIFPHHENEIAQSEGCSGKRFVRHWIHAEHLIVNGKKMSKSLGNFYTLRDLLDLGFSGVEVRYLLLSTHYRTQLNFTLEGLKSARQSLKRLNDFVARVERISGDTGSSFNAFIKKGESAFKEALGDDLNIARALASLFDVIRQLNSHLDQDQIGTLGKKEILAFLLRVDKVLGCLSFQKEVSISEAVKEALEKREKARAAKDWEEADRQRNLILKAGFLIEDSPYGPRLKVKDGS